MRLTVDQAVPDKAIAKEDLERSHNKDVMPVLRLARKALNARSIERLTPVVSDGAGTFVNIWTSEEPPTDFVWVIEAHINGVGATQRAMYIIQRTITATASVFSTGPTVFINDFESDALCDARVAIPGPGREITVDARDNGSEAMRWTCVVYVAEGLADE